MSDMTSDELLEILEQIMLDYLSDNNLVRDKCKEQAQQAYTQLKRIVEQHFKEKKNASI